MTTAQQTDSAGQVELSTAELQQHAERWAREFTAKHRREPTGEMVATAFNKSPRWGRDRVAAIRGTGAARQSGTVAEAAAARGLTPSGTAAARPGGTAGPAVASISTGAPAPAAARPAAPPAQPAAPSGKDSGTGAARLATPSGKAAARERQGRAARRAARRARFAEAAASGELIAWAGFVFGALVSVAANVMHALIPHPPAGLEGEALAKWLKEWTPDLAAVLASAIWPIMLLLAVEALTRVTWPSGVLWAIARYGGVGLVAAGSAFISYFHIYDVLLAWNYGEMGAAIGPFVVDGLMVVSGVALLAISKTRKAAEG